MCNLVIWETELKEQQNTFNQLKKEKHIFSYFSSQNEILHFPEVLTEWKPQWQENIVCSPTFPFQPPGI